MTSIDEFLKTGRLGPITCGMTTDAIRTRLGEPESVSVQKQPRLWKYGALQLTFSQSQREESPSLIAITLGFHTPEDQIPEALALTDWEPTCDTTFEEFRAHLHNTGTRDVGGVFTGLHQHLVLESAVRVSFDEGRLYSIGYMAKREPESMQLTVKIPKKDLDVIRQWANIRRISAADLCSEWIKEQVVSLQSQGSRITSNAVRIDSAAQPGESDISVDVLQQRGLHFLPDLPDDD